MIPILYDHFETDFTSNGIGRLEECVSCRVKEVINGEYELELVYPISGSLFRHMVSYGGIICATHDHNGDIQPFDIYRYSAPINGLVTFSAHHISYRLSNLICGPKNGVSTVFGGYTPEMVFESIPILVQTPNEFEFHDYTGYSPSEAYAVFDGYVSVRDAFLNGQREDDPQTGSKALYKVFPGEFLWDRFTVNYYRQRGSNKGVQIRYGKNMTEVTRERDYSDLISSVFPFWIGDNNGTKILITGNRAYSPRCELNLAEWNSPTDQMTTPDGEPYYFGSADLRSAAVDFSQEFQSAPTIGQLRQAALAWMSKNSTWRASDNITVKNVDLYNAEEDYAGLEECSLGDYVDIFYPELGIVSKNIEVVSLTFDVLTDSIIETELGQIKTTYAQVLEKTLNGGLRA